MTEMDIIARKWGDSIAVVIPSKIVSEQKIKPKDVLHVILSKRVDLSDLFGRFKTKKTAQEFKDESREGWQ